MTEAMIAAQKTAPIRGNPAIVNPTERASRDVAIPWVNKLLPCEGAESAQGGQTAEDLLGEKSRIAEEHFY